MVLTRALFFVPGAIFLLIQTRVWGNFEGFFYRAKKSALAVSCCYNTFADLILKNPKTVAAYKITRQWDKRRERRSWEKGGRVPVNQVVQARKKTQEN